MKYWHIRGNKAHLRCSLVSMLIMYETCFNPPWIVPVQVTKLPTTFFMFTKVPSTYLDQWLALSTNFPREYTCSLTISYSSRSEGHNYHILWWYFELQMDRIHINHLRSLVAADPTFRLTAAFTVCKKYFLFKIIEQERKLIYQGKQHLLSKISHHSSVSLGMRNEKWENNHYFYWLSAP